MLNPQEQQGEIYRLGQPKEVRQLLTQLSDEDVLPGFMLPVSRFQD